MSVARLYAVICEGPSDKNLKPPVACHRRTELVGTSQKARSLARRSGWTRLPRKGGQPGRDLCPVCARAET